MKTTIKLIIFAFISIIVMTTPWVCFLLEYKISGIDLIVYAVFCIIAVLLFCNIFEHDQTTVIYPGSFYYSGEAKKIRKSLGVTSVCMCLCLVGVGQYNAGNRHKHINSDGTVWYDMLLYSDEMQTSLFVDTTSGYYFSKHYVDSLKQVISLYKGFVDAILDPKFRELPYLGNTHEAEDQTEDMIYTPHGQSQIIIRDNRHIYIGTSAIIPDHKKYKWYLPEDQEEWRDTPQPTYTIPKGDTMTIKPSGNVIILSADSTQPVIMSYKIDGKTIKTDTIGRKPRFDIPYYKEGWVPFPKLPTGYWYDSENNMIKSSTINFTRCSNI